MVFENQYLEKTNQEEKPLAADTTNLEDPVIKILEKLIDQNEKKIHDSESENGDDIEKAWNIGRSAIIPEKSRERYEMTYQIFKKWCGVKNKNTSEKILLAYLVERNGKLKAAEWKNCVGICTNGDSTMSGRFQSLQELVKQKSPQCVWNIKALVCKEMSPGLNIVLTTVVTVVTYIKMRPVKSRIFNALCKDMGAEHSTLLFYCEAIAWEISTCL
ncbi:zinc finger BED domain-containing protein 5-like [Onthophagus taurus]|uniref:zinc finger BED domain-containing protein 5-like n=1 Tax=Onthophagus taurus TaxID=166361 RepID=UPI0039BE83C3